MGFLHRPGDLHAFSGRRARAENLRPRASREKSPRTWRAGSASPAPTAWRPAGRPAITSSTPASISPKNIINDMLFFALRIDSQKLPGDLLKAYYQVDLEALIAGNPSGRPSARQKTRSQGIGPRAPRTRSQRTAAFSSAKPSKVVWGPAFQRTLFRHDLADSHRSAHVAVQEHL